MKDLGRKVFTVLLWSLLIAPLSGGLAGVVIAYIAFLSVDTGPEFALIHGVPFGVLLGFLFGLVAIPSILKWGPWKVGAILFVSSVVCGLPFAILGIPAVSLISSMLGTGLLLIFLTLSGTLDK